MAKVVGVASKVDITIKPVPAANKIVAADINEIVTVVNTNDDGLILAQSTADTALANAGIADGKADSNLADIGNVTTLNTTNKTNTVSAINEVKTTSDTALANAATADSKAFNAQQTANSASNTANSLAIISIIGEDSFIHANRVESDGGTTIDRIPLDKKIRDFRSWEYFMSPHSIGAGKVYGQTPQSSDADASYSGDASNVVNKYGISVAGAANLPKLDYLGKYVPGVDNSNYQGNGVDTIATLPNPTVSAVTNAFSSIDKFKTGANVTTEQVIFSNVFHSNNLFSVGIKNGKFICSTSNGVTFNNFETPVLPNTIYTFGVSKPNTHAFKTIYLNGVDVSATSGSDVVNGGSSAGSFIGKDTSSLYYFLGQIHTHEDYNLELPAQIFEDRYNGLPIPDKYKGANNVDLVVNGDFESGLIGGINLGSGQTATWTLNALSPISGSQDGLIDVTIAGASSSRPTLKNLFTVPVQDLYRLSFDYKVNSGSPNIVSIYNGAEQIVINETFSGSGVFSYEGEFFVNSSAGWLYWKNLIYQLQIDNVKFVKLGNTLNLSNGKSLSTWRDLDHPINAVVSASLNQSNGFGNIRIPIKESPSLMAKGGTATNHFLNSSAAISQIVTGLTIGQDYTVNLFEAGIIEIDIIGTGQGGAATETNPYSFKAEGTSANLVLIGNITKVNLTDTKTARNHIPTGGSTVTVLRDVFTVTGLQSKGFIGADKGSFYVEFSGNNKVNDVGAGAPILFLSNNSGDILGIYTSGSNALGIRLYQQSILINDLSIAAFDGSKSFFSWVDGSFNVSVNGVDYLIAENISFTDFDILSIDNTSNWEVRVDKIALDNKPYTTSERNLKTTI